MPGLPDTMYCSQQIHISPMLPQILKQYAKSAIRTQPTDLLRWSAAYFRALSQNETPPEKKRLEYPEPKNYMGLTPGLLKVLLNQVGKSSDITISYIDLYFRWDGICMPQPELVKLLLSAEIDNAVAMPWYKIIAVAAGYLCDNLTQTMVLICNLLTDEPDGGNAMIPVDVFLKYYKFLAELNLSEKQYMLNVLFYIGTGTDEPDTHDKKIMQMELPQDLTNINPEINQKMTGRGSALEDSISLVSHVPPEFENIFRDHLPEKQSIQSEGFVVQDPEPILQKSDEHAIKESSKHTVVSSVSQTQTTSEIVDEQDLASPEKIPSNLSMDEKEETNETEEQEEESSTTNKITSSESLHKDETKSEETIKEMFSPKLPENEHLIQHKEVIELVSPFSQGFESVTSKFLGRISPHIHLNKYLASTTPSMVTEIESRFTTADISSETHTIFREEPGKPKDVKLVVKSPTQQVRYEIDEVRGIGPTVDPETMDTFIKYIEERAAFQHGMIMPRNITSFQCPPLENFKYMKKIEVEEDIPFVGCKNVY